MKHFVQLIIGITAVGVLFISAAAANGNPSPTTHDPQSIDKNSPPAAYEIGIESNGSRMGAILYKANGNGPHPTAILLHGFPGNEKNIDLAQAIRRSGFNALVFYYRGAWGSEGTYSLQNQLQDTTAVLAYLKDEVNASALHVDSSRLSLVGHSLGGFNALYSGAGHASVTCTVGIAPADLGNMLSSLLGVGVDLNSADMKSKVSGIGSYTIGDLFSEVSAHHQDYTLPPKMAAFKGRPLLVVSGSKDEDVSLASQMPLVDAAKATTPETFTHIIMEADHGFNWNRIALAESVTNWMMSNCR
jgi:pimeloyl-ACP methyl ester carboxylesterase